jgi:RNA polymerase sigma factor (sigma-70 family)
LVVLRTFTTTLRSATFQIDYPDESAVTECSLFLVINPAVFAFANCQYPTPNSQSQCFNESDRSIKHVCPTDSTYRLYSVLFLYFSPEPKNISTFFRRNIAGSLVRFFTIFTHNMEEVVRQSYSEHEKQSIFNQEFMPHINSMYNFAYRLTLDPDDAKDLLQDTYLKAFRFIESFQKGTNAKAWLFRILKNSFINDYRKKSKEPSKVDYQEVESFYNSEDVDRQITPDLRVEALQDMIGDEISVALNSLDVDFRTVIILCDLEGFKYEEMAKILDIPIGTVRSRLHRARNLLKEKLSEYARKMGYKNA